jgi:hypothetical protein
VLRRVFALALIAVTAAAGSRILPQLNYFLRGNRTPIGWDLKVVCSSLQALSAGNDPYLANTLFPLPYSVLHVYLLKPLCAITIYPFVYGIVFALMALASGIALWRMVPPSPLDRIAVLAAILFGFNTFHWQLMTGNPAVIELPLIVAVLLLLAEGKYRWAGIVFGVMASLKLLPFFGVLAFLCLPASARLRLDSIGAATTGFLGVEAINAALFSQWLPSYAAQLIGRLPGASVYEPGGYFNQNTIDLVFDGLQRLGIGQPVSGFALACLALGIASLAAMACAHKTPDHGELPPAAVVSLVMLVLWLFLFRQKNYAFETFVPLMIASGYGAGRETGRAAIMASIVVSGILNGGPGRSFLADYYQLLGVWAAVLVILFGAIVQLRWAPARQQRDTLNAIGSPS